MTLEDFVAKIREGTLRVRTASVSGSHYGTALAPLSPDDDIESIVAEAFTAGVFDAELVSWEQAVGYLTAALNG